MYNYIVTINTQLHRTLKTTPYEVVFGIKPFCEPVKSFLVTKEQEDQASDTSEMSESDTSEMSESDTSDSSCSSDRTKKYERKHQHKETNEHTTGAVTIYYSIILLPIANTLCS